MGQQSSKHNEAFAFTGNNVLIAASLQSDRAEANDLLLDQPEAYDLAYSGLAEDLAYIDQTYYAKEDDEQTPQEEQQQRIEGLTEITVDQRAIPSVSMDLTGRALVRVGPRIGALSSLTLLNLSHNRISTIPREIGNLVNLRVLNLSYNRLISIPDTVHRLRRLRAVNLSHNQLESLPKSMGKLSDLLVLIVNNNAIRHLPSQLGQLPRLATLHIAHNSLLESIPAEIADMPSLRKLVAHACNFPDTLPKPLSHGPPSLVETCARLLVRQRQKRGIAKVLKTYLATAKTCTACKGPYFDSCVHHYRIVHRVDTTINVDYRLCSLHWTTENDRLLYLFSACPSMPDGAVDEYAADMRSNALENLDTFDDDSYYYCRLVPSSHESSSHESLESDRTIPAQKGAGSSGAMHLFATRFL